MKTDPTKRGSTKYCEFHRDHGHRTNDCIKLRKEIEYLIRCGHLHRFMALEGQDQAPPLSPRQPTPTQHQQPFGEIHVISRGFAREGESSSARKAHLRSIRSGDTLEIQAVSKLPQLDNAIRVVPSAYHMDIKFPTVNGVGMVRGDQRVAKEYYSTLMKQKVVGSIYMDELDMRDEVSIRPTPSEELEPVQLDDQPEHFVYIGSKLAKDVKDLLIHFLKHNI